MIPHSFDYKRASSVEEAIEILQNGSYAKVLGGGHSLVPALKLRLNAPETLVDVTRIESLKGIAIEDDTLVIGAANTHHEIATSAEVQNTLSFLAQGYDPFGAAKLGVYLHGFAADLTLKNQSMESMLITDVIESLGKALKKTME